MKSDNTDLSLSSLTTLSTQQLRDELARSLTLSAQNLARLAVIWKELEQRGEDLSDLRTGLASYLPLIAAGQLDAEAVVRFAGNKTLLTAVSRLPVLEQHRLATGGEVDILTIDQDGNEIVRPTPAHLLKATQVRQIFGEGWVRNPEEQRAVIDQPRQPSRRKNQKISVDHKTGDIKVGRQRVSPSELFAALVDRYPDPPPRDTESDKPIPVRLTESEHRRIKVTAAESGQTIEKLMRMALHNAGLI